MKFSNFFAPTLKEKPKDAFLKSHEYLIRGIYPANWERDL